MIEIREEGIRKKGDGREESRALGMKRRKFEAFQRGFTYSEATGRYGKSVFVCVAIMEILHN